MMSPVEQVPVQVVVVSLAIKILRVKTQRFKYVTCWEIPHGTFSSKAKNLNDLISTYDDHFCKALAGRKL